MDVVRGPSGPTGPSPSSAAQAARASSSRQSERNQSQDQDQLEDHLKTVTLQDLEVKKHRIAKGHWGTIDIVQLKEDKWNDRAFALKKIKKSSIVSPNAQRNILAEKEILSSLSCDFIVRFYRTFQNPINVYILMEFCQGGELWNECPVKTNAAKFYVACVVEALSYLHQRDIIHRDVKPENVALDARGYAKLIDFGLAHRLEKDTKLLEICGTSQYFAPEIVRLVQLKKVPSSTRPTSGGYDESVDLWSLGQLTYNLLDGYPAFDADNFDDMFEEILGGMEKYALWGRLSSDNKDFILQLCKPDPTERLGYKSRGGFPTLRQHRWFQGIHWDSLRDGSFPPPKIPPLTDPTDISRFNKNAVSRSNSVSENTPPANDAEWVKYF